MTVQQEMELIRRRHRGLLRPENVVEYATDPETALHRRFQWDDSKAAREYRLWQARELIQCHVTVIETNADPVRTYVSLRDDRKTGGGGYRHVVEVMSDPAMRKRLLAEALDDAERWHQKYAQLKELTPIFQQIARARGKKKNVA